ncbi:GIY-YIG nuclease family protein [Deinococcus multiflagellatus]|uniref:GIY-YIG nuclease family protein n=1 Tax=Deinococcus multiflagellatus TaxID=1656887 RepID=A0ABW1ZRG2_9DEIO|nr:GIY-YIG nuclease family protein [Deinococcus multiflagellatus]MBZ9715543.1 GIY-YIG nuclease family protein [Deinococcus multiflagellatus]
MSRIPDSGVYAVENTITGQIYVGSSVNLDQRLATHRSSINTGHWDNKLLQRDAKAYGPEAFRFVILQRTSDVAELEYLERMWAQRLNALGADGYNPGKVSKYARIFEPTAEQIAIFEERFLLVTAEYTDDREAARALEVHGVKRPTGGARWSTQKVRSIRAQLAQRHQEGMSSSSEAPA